MTARRKSILPISCLKQLKADYRRLYGIEFRTVQPDGRVCDNRTSGEIGLALLDRARADALRESIRWGEPYVFFLAPGVVSWIVPIVDRQRVLGGLDGGGVTTDNTFFDLSSAAEYLSQAGWSRPHARAFVEKCPTWPQRRVRSAISFLHDELYRRTGYVPALLLENRENAQQQRQIGEAIQEKKDGTEPRYPLDDERVLLSLIRVGDRNGARGLLNQILASMFLRSPRLAVVRARAIELMGYLTRTAVEDSPMLDPLIERHQTWVEHIADACDFEELCVVLRKSLDDFMDSISLQGYNRTSVPVRKALDYIAANFTSRVTLPDVAAAAGLSTFRAAHLIKEVTGRTVLQHVKRLRIAKAQELLETTAQSYADIAYELGFADQSYFIKQFREVTGTTPARYRGERTPGR